MTLRESLKVILLLLPSANKLGRIARKNLNLITPQLFRTLSFSYGANGHVNAPAFLIGGTS